MAPLSDLFKTSPKDRDPNLVCEAVKKDIADFPNKGTEQKAQSLTFIEHLLAPLVQSIYTPTESGEASRSRGELEAVGEEPRQRHVLLRTEAKTNVVEPKNEQEIQEIVKKAAANGQIVRVIGSGHSVASSISDPTTAVLLNIKKLRSITISHSTPTTPPRVTVGAGCHLGLDPEDSTSTLENSLIYTINEAGYALPGLGGISHQTVAGFLMTGTSGGSIKNGVHDSIVGLRFVDGQGNIKEFSKDNGDPEFFAAGVSMGLFGVLTSVVIDLRENFFIKGTETISPISPLHTNPSLGCPVDVFGAGTPEIPSIKDHLQNTEFTRVLWWPQPGVERITIWKAQSTTVLDPSTGKPWPIKEYEELPQIGGSSVPAQIVARQILIALNLLESDNPLYRETAAALLGLFNPITEGGEAETFCDWWWRGLPMDNEISDDILPMSFSELWFPIEQAQNVMREMNELMTSDFATIGSFFKEIYGAKKSPFWMSPSYGRDVVRVDCTWFTTNPKGSPSAFFKPYWERFKSWDYRLHWGKYTPDDYGQSVRERYEKYDEWMAIREKMDPKQVFVTPYWRSRLAIPPVK